MVKKSGPMKISHEAYRANKMKDFKTAYLEDYAVAIAENPTLNNFLAKTVEDLNPLKVLDLFKRVSAEVSHLPI